MKVRAQGRLMEIRDGAGRVGLEQIEHDRTRLDLPHCGWCQDGTLCNCQVQLPPKLGETRVAFGCACIGFIGCPVCPRTASSFWLIG